MQNTAEFITAGINYWGQRVERMQKKKVPLIGQMGKQYEQNKLCIATEKMVTELSTSLPKTPSKRRSATGEEKMKR